MRKTLGPLLWDRKSKQINLSTAAHSVPESGGPIVFLTEYKHNNQDKKVELCRVGFLKYFAGDDYDTDQSTVTPLLIDALLLPIDPVVLNQPHIFDMFIKDSSGQSADVSIYEGDMQELLGLHVIMLGNASGRQEGFIMDVNDSTQNVRGSWFRMGFVVALKEGNSINQKKSMAQIGDSGAPIIGLHPSTGQLIFIGSVYGGNPGKQTVQSNDDKQYENLTYCTAFQTAKQYFHAVHGLTLECYTPQAAAADSGYSTGAFNDGDHDASREPRSQSHHAAPRDSITAFKSTPGGAEASCSHAGGVTSSAQS